MKPDYNTAATKAAETLIKYNITSAPVDPLHIMKQLPGVLVLSHSDVSGEIGITQSGLLKMLGNYNQDAVTAVRADHNTPQYLVVYNQQMPSFSVMRSIAREMGHILLNHDESCPEEVRAAEAVCFASHLLMPRALIHALQNAGVRLTTDLIGNLFGCYDECLNAVETLPRTTIQAELNRKLERQFSEYVESITNYSEILSDGDMSPLAHFGSYMEGYEE